MAFDNLHPERVCSMARASARRQFMASCLLWVSGCNDLRAQKFLQFWVKSDTEEMDDARGTSRRRSCARAVFMPGIPKGSSGESIPRRTSQRASTVTPEGPKASELEAMLEGISERSLWRKTALGSGWFTSCYCVTASVGATT